MFKKLLGKVKFYGLGKKYDINKIGKKEEEVKITYIIKNNKVLIDDIN